MSEIQYGYVLVCVHVYYLSVIDFVVIISSFKGFQLFGHTFTMQALHTLKKALCTLTRALYTLKRALCTFQRALDTLQRALYTRRLLSKSPRNNNTLVNLCHLLHVCSRMCVRMYTFNLTKNACLCVRVRVRVCVFVNVYIYIYVHLYTNIMHIVGVCTCIYVCMYV